MPPKAKSEEMEEIKKSLNGMTEELAQIANKQTQLLELMEEVKHLKNMIEEKDEKIKTLQERVDDLEKSSKRIDDLEQYSRMDDLVITGLETRHQTYARAASSTDKGEDAPVQELQTLEEQIIQFFEKYDMRIESNNISTCHVLPKRKNGKSSIIVRFTNRKSKVELLRNARKLYGTNVYVNEHLTKKNAEIAKEARLLRKQKKINATWTRNCKIMIRENGPEDTAQIKWIKELNDLDSCK